MHIPYVCHAWRFNWNYLQINQLYICIYIFFLQICAIRRYVHREDLILCTCMRICLNVESFFYLREGWVSAVQLLHQQAEHCQAHQAGAHPVTYTLICILSFFQNLILELILFYIFLTKKKKIEKIFFLWKVSFSKKCSVIYERNIYVR